MKRALAMGLGALMVAGSAAPASAASHIDFSGYYRIMYMSETNTGYGRESRSFTDSYFQDRLQLDLTFSPTDEISIYWRLRGPGSYQRWGNGGRSEKSLYTQFIYGEIKQDWGTVLIGRMSDDLDCAGLCAFGYMPENIPVFTNVGAFDRGDIMDGVRYTYDWDNGFSILAQYVKLGTDAVDGGSDPGVDLSDSWSDADYNRFQLQGAYTWDGGGAALHVFYDRDATGYTGSYGDRNKREQWGLNPAIMHTWGDFSVHFEGMATWGQDEFYAGRVGANNSKRFVDEDIEGFGAYLDFDYNYGPGNATLAGWWVSGTDVDEAYKRDGKNKSAADLVGGNFYPLLVAYNGLNSNPAGNRHFGNAGAKVSAIGFANNAYENYISEAYNNAISTGFLNNANYSGFGAVNLANPEDAMRAMIGAANRTRTVSFNNDTDANHWAIALTGNHAFTDDISMHYGLAYLGLNKPNYRIAKSASFGNLTNAAGTGQATMTSPSYFTQDKDLGFEIDLGFTFQLLDNLKFTSAFGYMFNGDAYKQLKGYRWTENTAGTAGNIKAVWEDADDSYVWFNSLTFAF